MSSAYVPYNGTAGWSGTDTSKERALVNLRTGKEYNNQQKALAYLKNAGHYGLTWQELAIKAGWHHGTASGVLSVLHKAGAIIRTYDKRNKCRIYMDISFKDEYKNDSYVTKQKLCPHCGHDITT